MARAEGIWIRHSRKCPVQDGKRCTCSPSYVASAYDAQAGKKIRRTFRKFSEAKAWRHDATGKVKRGELRPSTKQTVAEAAEAWLEGVKSGTMLSRTGKAYKPAVARGYEHSLRTYVLPDLGRLRLSDLTRQDVQRLVDKALAAGLDPSTIRNAIMPLRALFRYAIRRGHVTVNPTSNLDMPACNSRRVVHASREKVETFLAALPDNLRPLYATAVYAGLRRGELRGLKWEDVDLANGLIHVRRGWDDKEGEIAPKSAKALRDVPLFGILRDYLDEHKLRTGGSGSDFVFASKRGNPFTPSNLRKQAAKACREAEVKCFGLHELRHVFVSFCVDMGFDLAEIGDYVGHSTVYMIDRYRHLLEGKRQEARARADAYFAGTGTRTGTQAAETLS
jgi:integrase